MQLVAFNAKDSDNAEVSIYGGWKIALQLMNLLVKLTVNK